MSHLSSNKKRQFNLIIPFVTVPVQLIAFCPGFNAGNFLLMWPFIRLAPRWASSSTKLITMLPEKFSSSTMVTLTMSVIFPEPVTGRTVSEYTLPGFMILVPDMATTMPLPALA